MSFDPLRYHPRLRVYAPWVTWCLVLLGVAWLAPGLGAVGVIAASAEVRQASLTAPRTARVLKVTAKPGDVVKVGDVLVELDPSGIDSEIAIARADLRAVEANAIADANDARSSDLEGRARLAQEAERAEVTLATLLSDEKRDTAELKQVDELIAKQDKLIAQRLASAEQRDDLRLHRASLAQRVAEYPVLVKAARTHQAASRERLQAWRARGGQPATPEDAGDAGNAEADAQAERVGALERTREQLVVRATTAGQVAEVFVTEGSIAPVDQPLVIVVDDKPSRVIAWVDQTASSYVRVGQRASLRPSDRQGPMRVGVVAALGPGIAEIPMRFRAIPTQPSFGRAVYIDFVAPDAKDAAPIALPGQAFDVTFTGERE